MKKTVQTETAEASPFETCDGDSPNFVCDDSAALELRSAQQTAEDDGSHQCDSCSLEFATCGSKTAKFYSDISGDSTEDDYVVSCGSHVAKESVIDIFVCDETSEPFTRVLPVVLTAEEQAVMGAEMARLIGIWTKAKLDKQAFDKSMKNLIDSTEEDYIAIAVKATEGTEDRPTECYWQMDKQHGLKRLYRCDTGAMVEEKNMELLDYKSDETTTLEESIKNVQDMAQGEAVNSPEPEAGDSDTDVAENTDNASESNSDDIDKGWPDPPERTV